MHRWFPRRSQTHSARLTYGWVKTTTKTTLEHVDGTTAKTAENDFAGTLAAGAEVELESVRGSNFTF